MTRKPAPYFLLFTVLLLLAVPFPASADIDVATGGDYDVWTISGKEIYDLDDDEVLSNILVDQSAAGATLTIRARNKSGWVVRNVGFLGVGQDGDGGNSFQMQVSAPSGGSGRIENVWMNGKARDGLPGTRLGGIYIRASHAGHIDIRHTWIEGFGNNAVYGSAVGKDGGNEGTVLLENCYHRDNTVSQFRIGSPGSVVRNCVGVVDDPEGLRGPYPSSGSRNARGIWGKHFRGQRIENSSIYVSPDDFNPDGAFEARYIGGRSRGPEAVLEVVDCDVNADAPTLTGTTANARVEISNLGNDPTVRVIQGGGVPLTPRMAAIGGRAMPAELPGASGNDDDEMEDEDPYPHELQIDGRGVGRTDYRFTVDGELTDEPTLGGIGTGDMISGSSAEGFVNGGTDGYAFSGVITYFEIDGEASVFLDGQSWDPATCCGASDSDESDDADDGATGLGESGADDPGEPSPDVDQAAEASENPPVEDDVRGSGVACWTGDVSRPADSAWIAVFLLLSVALVRAQRRGARGSSTSIP